MLIDKFTSKILFKTIDKNPVFFFDFDGTLADIVLTPEEAGLKPITRHVLEELTKLFPVGIISGRKLEQVRKLVGIKGIFYSGNHGVEIEGPRLKFVEPESAKAARYITSLGREIELSLKPYHPRMNFKKYSVSVHYRTVDPDEVKMLLTELNKIIYGPFRAGKIDVLHGKKVVEIKSPSKWNKGDAIAMIMQHVQKLNSGTGSGRNSSTSAQKLAPIFFGDDTTDEYGFKRVNKLNGASVFVGRQYHGTAAKYRTESPVELVGELAKFLFELK